MGNGEGEWHVTGVDCEKKKSIKLKLAAWERLFVFSSFCSSKLVFFFSSPIESSWWRR